MTTLAARSEEEPELSDDIPVLELVEPLVGFPGLHRFALARLAEDGTVCDLRSLEDPQVSFVVVPPGAFFESYAPEIGDDVVEALEVRSPEDVLVLVMLTLGETLTGATANLRAPILVNHHTRRGLQTILEDAELPMRAPLGVG